MAEPANFEEDSTMQEDGDEVGAAGFESRNMAEPATNAWQQYCDEVEEAASKSFAETLEQHTDETREDKYNDEKEKAEEMYNHEAEKHILANLKSEAEDGTESHMSSMTEKEIANMKRRLKYATDVSSVEIQNMKRRLKYAEQMFSVDCAECGKTFKSPNTLQGHMRIAHGERKEFPCDKCSKVFPTKSNLKQHHQRIHSTVRDYVCLVCNKGCVTKAELVIHMKYHTKEKSYVCDREGCSYSSYMNADLKAHKNQHDGIMLTCDHCEKLFNKQARLNYHIKHVHLKVPSKRTERRREQAMMKAMVEVAPPPKTEEHICPECGKTFKRDYHMKRHMLVHSDTFTIEEKTCPECGKVFKNPELMGRHMVVHQNSFECMKDLNQYVTSFYSKTDCGTKLKCIECGKEYLKHKNLKEHVLNIHIRERDDMKWQTIIDPVDGSQTKVMLTSENKFNDPCFVPSIAEPEREKPQCNKCGNVFSTMQNLKEHDRNVHILKESKDALKPSKEEIKFSAELVLEFNGRELVQVLDMVRTLKECGKIAMIERIRESGNDGRGYRAAFEEMGAFENFGKTEHDWDDDDGKEAKLEVKVDPEDLNWEDEVKEEPESDSEETEETAEIPFFEETFKEDDQQRYMETHNEEKTYMSENSGVGFSQSSDMNNTMITHTGERPFICTECGAGFPHSYDLKRHMRKHTGEKTFICQDCGAGFFQSSDLKKHMSTHTGEKPFSCKDCGAVFSRGSNLKAHMTTHTGEKPFICMECGARFPRHGNLKKHMLTHTGEKPFICKECGARFSHSGDLKRHMRIHTGAKPYICQNCGAGFSQSCDLKNHMRTHTGEKPFTCIECGTAFSRGGNLKTHMLIHTGEKPFICRECGTGFAVNRNLKKHMLTHNGDKPFDSTPLLPFLLSSRPSSPPFPLPLHSTSAPV